MIEFLIKHFAIIFCSLFVFSKLINKQANRKQVLLWIPITFFICIITYFARLYIAPLNIITTFIFIFYFTLIFYKKTINVTVVFSIISLSIGFLTYIISMLVCLPISFAMFLLISNQHILDYISFAFVGIVQFWGIFFLFKIKRIKNGIHFLENRINDDLSTFISIILLFLTSLIYITDGDRYIDIISTLILIIIGILLFLILKKHSSLEYTQKMHQRNIKIYEDELSEQIEITAHLMKHNEELSKVIHRDNKLIPAMEVAVEEILNCQSPDEQKEKSRALLIQLKAMSAERTGIITKYETTNKKLPSTGIFSVDSSLKYLLKKANDKDIIFDLSITAEISNITNNTISEDELNTLILDLGENAIIATSDMEHRNVLVVMGYEDDSFCINIFDSGNHFDPKVISKLGIKRITTHKNTGGSGIGMMTTFELLQKYQASLVLDETINSNKFTKKVTVQFDTKNEYHIQTNRAEVISISKKRTDLIIN